MATLAIPRCFLDFSSKTSLMPVLNSRPKASFSCRVPCGRWPRKTARANSAVCMMPATKEAADRALADIAQVFEVAAASTSAHGDPAVVLVEQVYAARAKTIFCYGVGREGLMMKALAMRLFHLGLSSSVVGDMSCPAAKEGDLLIVSAGPGTFTTVEALIGVASQAGSKVLVITAQPQGKAAAMANEVAVLPAQTMANDREQVALEGQVDVVKEKCAAWDPFLPMGSVYEGALYILFEIVVLALRDKLGESVNSMRSRHTNLE